MGRGPGWTAEETATLLRMIKRNAGWNEIADAVGRSVASCKNKLSHPSRYKRPSADVEDAIRRRGTKRSRWTPETEAELIRLREVEKLSWLDIDGHFGRMHGACSDKYSKLKQDAGNAEACATSPPAERQTPPWSEADMTLAQARWRELFVDAGRGTHADRGRVCEAIGAAIDRTATVVASRLRTHGVSFGLHAASKPLPQPVEISQAMIDREARKRAEARRSLTARFFGDPAPGYSALDERRQQCSSSSISMPSRPAR